MTKQLVIVAIVLGIIAAVFAPFVLRDRSDGEDVTQVAESTDSGDSAGADSSGTSASSGAEQSAPSASEAQTESTAQAPSQSQTEGEEPSAEAAGQTTAGSGSATSETSATQVQAATEAQSESTESQTGSAEAEQVADAASDAATETPKTEQPSEEAASTGQVAAQIRIADAPTIKEDPEPGSQGASEQSSDTAEASGDSSSAGSTEMSSESTASDSSEPVVALEQGSAEDPQPESETAGTAATEGEVAIEVVTRSDETPQVAALPDQSESIELPEGRPPSFDVVRVEPTGEAVIAGRAEPGSRVTLTDDGEEIASVQADSAGDWVIILDEPLEGGSHQLGLSAESPGGGVVESENVVIVAVPEQPTVVATRQDESQQSESDAGVSETAVGEADVKEPAGEALAVLAPREGEGPSIVLQRPDPEGLVDRELVLNAIDYDAEGRVIISGKAPPGSRVVVYLDDRAIGQVQADENGSWVLRPETAVAVGLHRLRLDQLDESGKVVARIESPFSRAQALLDLPGERFVVVQPGNSLWFIARETYGQGLRYTLIFDSNNGQIRDPDLIYPGQIFLVPELN